MEDAVQQLRSTFHGKFLTMFFSSIKDLRYKSQLSILYFIPKMLNVVLLIALYVTHSYHYGVLSRNCVPKSSPVEIRLTGSLPMGLKTHTVYHVYAVFVWP